MTRRAILLGVPAVVALAAAVYAALWWIAADRLARGLDRWAETQRRNGWTIGYEAPRTAGFPGWIALEIGRPEIEAPVRDGTARWTGATLTLRARPWRWRRIGFAAPGRHEARYLHLPSRRVVHGRAEGVEGRVRLTEDGWPNEIAARLSGVHLRSGDSPSEVRIAAVDAVVEMPRALELRLRAITLPADAGAPLGRTIERVDLTAALSQPIPSGPLSPALVAWRDSGGDLRLRDVAVRWGPLGLAGKGSFVLDRALQPRGQMTVSAEGYDETVAALARAGQVKPRDAMGARIVLGLLARPGPNGAARVTLPLTIQDGVIAAGPQRLARLPRIHWE